MRTGFGSASLVGIALAVWAPAAGAQIAGFRFHTKPWDGTQVTSPGQARALFESLPDDPANYTCANVTTMDGTTNTSLTSNDSNIATEIETTLTVDASMAGTWGFRMGPDFGGGGTLLVDGAEVQSRWSDMWWNNSWSDPTQYLEGFVSLSAGAHTLVIYGFEVCCDGSPALEAMPPQGTWQALDTSSFQLTALPCTCASDADCPALGSCQTAGTCDASSGTCTYGADLADGTACNDDSACTAGETCSAGICTDSTAYPACPTPPASSCLVESCDPTTGTCSQATASDGTACDTDGRSCTTETCQSGTCTAGANLCNCNVDGDCGTGGDCFADRCDYASGTCYEPSLPDGTSCQSGVANCSASACVEGQCEPQTASCQCTTDADCPLQDQCQLSATCTNGQCVYTYADSTTTCDDSNPCTLDDVCTPSGCAGTPVTCAPMDACHTASCNPVDGICTQTPTATCAPSTSSGSTGESGSSSSSGAASSGSSSGATTSGSSSGSSSGMTTSGSSSGSTSTVGSSSASSASSDSGSGSGTTTASAGTTTATGSASGSTTGATGTSSTTASSSGTSSASSGATTTGSSSASSSASSSSGSSGRVASSASGSTGARGASSSGATGGSGNASGGSSGSSGAASAGGCGCTSSGDFSLLPMLLLAFGFRRRRRFNPGA